MAAGFEFLSVRAARQTVIARAFYNLTNKISSQSFPITLNAGYELVLIFGFLFFLELFIPGILAVGYMEPHPFWIPVLLLSVQYGMLTGLATAVAAIFARFFVGWPMPDGGEDYYGYFLRIWHDPALWLGAAIVIGSLSDRLIRQRDSLAASLRQADEQRHSIGHLCEELTDYTQQLECQIASSEDRSLDAALVSACELQASSPSNLARALRRAVDVILGTEITRYSVFAYTDWGVLRVNMAADGVPPALQMDEPAVETVNAALVRAVVGERRTLVSRRMGEAKILTGVGVAACPIVDDKQSVAGILVIDEALGPVTAPQLIGLKIVSGALARHIRSLAETVSAQPKPATVRLDHPIYASTNRGASPETVTPL